VHFRDLFWNWIFRWWRLVIFVGILIFLVSIFITHTFIIVTLAYPSGTKDNIELTQVNQIGKESSVLRIGSLALIARDTGRLEGKVGRWQTTVDVTPLPWVGLKEVRLQIERDKNVDKVAGESLGCTIYNPDTDQIASYSCGSPNGLYTYTTSRTDGVEWKNEAVLTFPPALTVASFGKGLLGIENSSSPQLFYADPSTKTVTLPTLPGDFNSSDLNSTNIVTDAVEPTDHFLLINANKGVVYFASRQGNDFTYQRYTPDKKWLTGAGIQCVLRQKTAYCYIGSPSTAPDSHEETEEHSKRTDGRIVTIEFKDSKVDYAVSVVPSSEPLDHLYIDDSRQLYAMTNSTLYSLDNSQYQIRRNIVAPIASAVSSGKTLYYVTDNRLFEFDNRTKATYLRFYSDNLKISTINQLSSRVFINAFIDSSRNNVLHTYQLLQEQNTTPDERLVDKIPTYLKPNDTPIISMDYYKDTIHIVLPDYVTYGSKGEIVPNNQAFDEAKQVAINYLSTLISDIKNYTITFSRATNS